MEKNTNDYIDNTIEVIMQVFEQNGMTKTEKYEKIKEIQEKRKKGKKI